MSSYRSIKLGLKEIKCIHCEQVKSVKEFPIYMQHGEQIYYQYCKECMANRERKIHQKVSMFCQKCVNFSVIRQKCKLGKKMNKCEDFDEFLYYNV